jgi:hypothetical protein
MNQGNPNYRENTDYRNHRNDYRNDCRNDYRSDYRNESRQDRQGSFNYENSDNTEEAPKWANDIVSDYAKIPFGSSFAQIVINEEVVKVFEDKLYSLWKHGKTGFPGSLAVSILREHVPQLESKKYHILPKSDGCRYIMYSFYVNDEAVVVMFDRSGSHYTVTLSLCQSVFSGTILDGELVTYKDGTIVFQVFDCIATCGNMHYSKPYSERMKEAKNFVDNLYTPDDEDPFKIDCKLPCTKDQARAYMSMDFNDPYFPLNYPVDGIMLVRDESPYICGLNDSILKVKKPHDHTVDFYTRVWEKKDDNRSRWICELMVSEDRNRKLIQSILITTEILERLEIPSPNSLKDCIVECFWNSVNNQWEPRKLRRDKLYANNMSTFERTVQTIRENISVKELMNLIK